MYSTVLLSVDLSSIILRKYIKIWLQSGKIIYARREYFLLANSKSFYFVIFSPSWKKMPIKFVQVIYFPAVTFGVYVKCV